MYCVNPECSATLADDANFCSKCGRDQRAPFTVPPTPVKKAKRMTRSRLPPPVAVPVAHTDIEDLLDIDDSMSQRIATFRLSDVNIATLGRQMKLPVYPFGTLRDELVAVNGAHRYRLEPFGDDVELHLLVAGSAMGDLAARDYIAAVDALIEVLPQKYHADIDPTLGKTTKRGTLWEQLGINDIESQTVAEFSIEDLSKDEMVAALALPSYVITSGIDNPVVVVNGAYRYFMFESGSSLLFDILVAENAMASLEAREYTVAVAMLLQVLPKKYHAAIGPIANTIKASMAAKQLPAGTKPTGSRQRTGRSR